MVSVGSATGRALGRLSRFCVCRRVVVCTSCGTCDAHRSSWVHSLWQLHEVFHEVAECEGFWHSSLPFAFLPRVAVDHKSLMDPAGNILEQSSHSNVRMRCWRDPQSCCSKDQDLHLGTATLAESGGADAINVKSHRASPRHQV